MEELIASFHDLVGGGSELTWFKRKWGTRSKARSDKTEELAELSKREQRFIAALEVYVNARIKYAIAAEMKERADYAKQVSMPDVAKILHH